MYKLLFWIFFRRLPAETAHRLGFGLICAVAAVPGLGRLLRNRLAPHDPVLRVRALGLDFAGPLGLAAGFDKDAVAVDALGAVGFAFVEIGTVTAQPQPGNPTPQLFRLMHDRALINRMGFNNTGSAAAVSSPNTPGLRNLQAVEHLRPLLVAVRDALDASSPRRVPLLVKIAPDLADADIDAVADLALALGLDGIVATNTTVSRDGLVTGTARLDAIGAGGVSGAPLRGRSLAVLRRLRGRVGDRLVLVAVGGIETADDAWARIEAGATLVQAYTGFIYGGPLWPHRIHRGLARLAREAGVTSISEVTGSALP
ncbi:MAG: dihydroorotate dehydrogenase (quinone) [Pseudonocardiaceae bacterium]